MLGLGELLQTIEPVSKEDYIQWKNNPITKRLYLYSHMRIRAIEESLGVNAGHQPLFDRFCSGQIDSYKDILDWKLDEEEGEENA